MAGSVAKTYTPEKLSEAIAGFESLCTETFLRELYGVLPNDDDVSGLLAFITDLQRGKLLTHSADTEAELELLHPADRLMVRLIQLPHLSDRVKGMLFRVHFDQNIELLRNSLQLLTAACTDLRDAKCFRQLLNVILVMGNYLNGTNYAGGAFGFKVASINRVSSMSWFPSDISLSIPSPPTARICFIFSSTSCRITFPTSKPFWTSWPNRPKRIE